VSPIETRPNPAAGDKARSVKDYVVERLISAAPERIPASVLLRELRERAYTEGHTMLRQWWPHASRSRQLCRLSVETEPGEQMRVDWAVIQVL